MWVKVTAVEPDEHRGGEVRVNGSMRAVSQADGTDLDPAGRLTAGACMGACAWRYGCLLLCK